MILCVTLLQGCAKTSPRFESVKKNVSDGKNAEQIFNATLKRHGGDHLDKLQDLNVAIDGEWYYLITKIQPKVTDKSYRQKSEERILLSPSTYAAFYRGDAGSKRVYRAKGETSVAYNAIQTSDSETLSATALTSDAFYLFSLGPLALAKRNLIWKRIEDGEHKKKAYYRINTELTPGFGESKSDFITMWIDKETNLTYRVHITLEGFETTKGAHVDTTFLKYLEIEEFAFPVHFFERVIGPISIDAHEWWYTGIDINRDLKPIDVSIEKWSEKAGKPAEPLMKRIN